MHRPIEYDGLNFKYIEQTSQKQETSKSPLVLLAATCSKIGNEHQQLLNVSNEAFVGQTAGSQCVVSCFQETNHFDQTSESYVVLPSTEANTNFLTHGNEQSMKADLRDQHEAREIYGAKGSDELHSNLIFSQLDNVQASRMDAAQIQPEQQWTVNSPFTSSPLNPICSYVTARPPIQWKEKLGTWPPSSGKVMKNQPSRHRDRSSNEQMNSAVISSGNQMSMSMPNGLQTIITPSNDTPISLNATPLNNTNLEWVTTTKAITLHNTSKDVNFTDNQTDTSGVMNGSTPKQLKE
ncbi:uncharacterized protein LOC124453350 [Xenia sp. Carnegie-2017]|uniref:uncharacterized protein LOC124453350 n=1 Tax=Xenia sp. Carnegie-2017 TaxID=2897299 RepID=UPI001F0393DD|nr:uncharacterized protein LOC124453350 [Xenia sp. Carnegie-2017]